DKPFAARNIFSKDRRIGDLIKKSIDTTIVIHDGMTVAELEGLFTDKFNLPVQVFRRSGNIWLETTMTDGWTLKQQNEHGKEITNGVPKTTLQPRNLDEDVQ
ncbi:MAG TPA: hypothetical protein VLC28_12970, partial [Flavitalea sp.]|nr:hypothetical protein [Flavitalea sp.]